MAFAFTKEGKIPFQPPGTDVSGSTYYKIFGDLSIGAPPVVILHGGPGVGHEYLLTFANLWHEYGLPVIFYDQVGCASSTHLPQMAGDKDFWQESLFVAELQNLLDHFSLCDANGPGFHLYGHSFGGRLAAAFATSRPQGLQRLVLASALASTDLSIRGNELRRHELPTQTREVLEKCVANRDFGSAAFKEASMIYNKTFFCREEPMPELLMPALKHMSETAVMETILGPSIHLNPGEGSMSGWTCIPRLPQIKVPTLVYNAEFDTSHDISQVPFFELIPRVRWITFAKGSHMCHLEREVKDKVLKVVGDFLIQDRKN
ncbi:Alpha/Beta hydrolase protein [Coniella lustricola]|uniref:Alpha/Beta hydrolase protein n=1 Tax=Coniella lustricola TaxID=2025994 RepID=A0A2T3A4C0_9PEZI|nr:Alpha/Beta hydrolase protein [Coniella lustricola]